MNESKHTPGPWGASYIRAGLRANEFTVSTPQGDLLLHTGLQAGQEQARANARLIGAAPDMLEALEAFDAARTSPELTTAHKLARAAIAKARG